MAGEDALTEANKLAPNVQASVGLPDTPDQDDSAAISEPIERQSPDAGLVAATDATTLPRSMPISMLANVANKQIGSQGADITTEKSGAGTTTAGSLGTVGSTASVPARVVPGTRPHTAFKARLANQSRV